MSLSIKSIKKNLFKSLIYC